MIKDFHQVEGQFGHNRKKRFDPMFAVSENGSVTNEIFMTWFSELIMKLYPDAQDIPGKRDMLNGDSGPGRFNKQFLLLAKVNGIYFYPGLPNGTEIHQEMDRLYALIKSIMEHNQSCIFDMPS